MKILTPDEFRQNVATVVISAGSSLTVPSITELTGAYTILYTRYQELRGALKRISARSNVCENDNEGQCFCCAANGEIVNAALAQGE